MLLHPSSASPVRAIRVSVERVGHGLRAHYRIDGDLARVRIPPPARARCADDLWRHTCFELFVARKGSEAYQEFNFSPSGEWAAYAFDGYRLRAGNLDIAPRMRGLLEVELAETEQGPIGVSAVIEDVEGNLSYWALRHPPGKPDFHHRDAFALVLE